MLCSGVNPNFLLVFLKKPVSFDVAEIVTGFAIVSNSLLKPLFGVITFVKKSDEEKTLPK